MIRPRQWPQIWAAGNKGKWHMHDNEVGYYSMYAPAKNALPSAA